MTDSRPPTPDPRPLAVHLVPSRNTLPYLADAQILYVLAELSAAETPASASPANLPLNLALLIDRSTSMKGGRLTQVKAAVNRLIDALEDKDTLSIVTFSDRAEIVLPSQRPVNKLEAKSKINAIHAGGGTELFRGMMYGLAELYKGRDTQGLNHLILLTDGRTYGDEEDCLALTAEAAPDGVAVSALGMGNEWNDEFLDRLAGSTGGTSSYIENEDQVARFLDEHIRALDTAFAHDLRVQARPQPRVELKSLFKLTPSPQLLIPDRNVYHLGSMSSGGQITLLLELVVQPHADGYHHLFDLEVTGQCRTADDARHTTSMDPSFTGLGPAVHGPSSVFQASVDFAAPFSSSALTEPPPPRMVAALAQLSLYRMHERSLKDAEQGQTARATRRLQALAGRLDRLGEGALASTALAEADRLERTGNLSEEGRKRLKYGTRALIATAPRMGRP